MGSIRTMLAIAVVFGHTYGFVFVGGQLAVQFFYAISGFLISYILLETTTYKCVTSFYINRFLRLFPIYWFFALATLLSIAVAHFFLGETHQVISTFQALSLNGKIALTLSNLVLFGQDWIMFTGVRGGELLLVKDFQETEVQVWQGLLVPQAWTLGVELSFYAIAPFVLSRKKLVVTLLVCSICLRVYFLMIGLGTKDPWTYRFFPTELALFLLGACSHQVLKPFYEKKDVLTEQLATVLTTAVFFYCCIFFLLPYKVINTIVLLTIFIAVLPFLFKFQSNKRWDREIGDLSYPIYISHMFVLWTSGYLLNKVGIQYNSVMGSLIIVIITVMLSKLINLSIGGVVEDFRLRVKAKQSMELRSD